MPETASAPPPARWQKAQAYEQRWWATHRPLRLDYFRGVAELVQADLAPYGVVGPESRVLEIGSGPAGIVTALPGVRRVGTDPLENFFASVEPYRDFRDPAVEYAAVPGEALPFDDGAFTVVVSDNVLDHVADPAAVLAEAYRVLAPGGLVWLRLHVFHRWGRTVRHTLERFEVDHGHPHTFTADALRRLAADAGFEVLRSERGAFGPAWWSELRAGTLKRLAHALLFVTRVDATLVLRRPLAAAATVHRPS